MSDSNKNGVDGGEERALLPWSAPVLTELGLKKTEAGTHGLGDAGGSPSSLS